MIIVASARGRLAAAGALIALVAGAAGFGIAHLTGSAPGAEQAPTGAAAGRKVLYWYDPMVPSQHFDKPGKSPFMDMELVPKYADEAGGEASGIRIDPAVSQNLGLRMVTARRGELASNLTATGTIDFNQRDVAVVQARAAGFVQRVYGRAPGDVVGRGAPLADVLVPEWAGAQAEYLAVRRASDPALARAARQRLILLGMPAGTIAAVERTGRPHNIVSITIPVGGAIRTLGVRPGMSVMAGQTLAEVNGLGTVWLNAAVPEAIAGQLRPGQTATATLAAYPGETFSGRITAILPEAQSESRTLTVRIELPNRGGRVRPGMFAAVSFGGAAQSALLVPSEALIRTGKRTLVMLALDNGRYRPAEVRTGRDSGSETEILAGLRDGEKIVASGQFLLDSEASLSGVEARPIGEPSTEAKSAIRPTLYESIGRIEKITPDSIALSHEPVPALSWPAMTMTFRLRERALARGYKTGDRVRFAFDQRPAGPTLQRLTKAASR